MAAFDLTVRFRKKEHAIQLAVDPSTEQVASAIATVTGAAAETIKLLLPGKKGQMLKLTANSNQSAQLAGLESGMRVEVYASTKEEVEQVRNSKDLPGLASFEQEMKQTMRRQRGSSRGKLTLPSGPYTFQKFEAWQRPGLSPVPSEAMKLLFRLAADPGIIGIVSKHRWTVGLLSEMPPEGKVGVSPVCILGVNINAGQEISLRLRTDDLKGFRRYDRIRETLCHELAHMVWGSHDPAFENPAEAVWVDEDDIMAVTAQSSGQTLRSLGGGSQQPGVYAGDSSLTDADSSKHQVAGAPQELSQQSDVTMEDFSDDSAVQRYKQAEAAVLQLKSQAGAAGQQPALETLAKILQNIVSHPARELLRVAGFTEEAEGAVDRSLVWKRNDQGLLWLTLSAVNNALSGIA
ncbi:hypothetical protein WJX82_002765 [Trebouxia sp. C0006]